MVAFIIAFFVIASSKLVTAINESIGRVFLLMLVSISFLLLIGTFFSYKEETFLEKDLPLLDKCKQMASTPSRSSPSTRICNA
jgi:hypothetical protein